ncbi:MAG TPA: ABC transporter ATP-binding protein [Salinimicrobium sp.]|nr:ABC transporter ATP-binding protein [Salinimicrobium sp.]
MIEKQNINIETRNLKIGYQSKKGKSDVASGINIEIFEAELVAVIGVNGIGKSTLLRTLSGVQTALDGEIFIQKEDRKDISEAKLSTLISLVLTEQPISKNLSVEELVALGRQPYTNWIGSLSKNDKIEIKNAIELVGIEEIRTKKCHELSDGQMQKALIARALAQNTPIMILDEPTSHLDLYHKAQVLKLLKNLSQKTKKSILFATHEINLALQLCDKIILMKNNGIQSGNPQKLIQKGAFQELFPSDLIVFDEMTNSFKIRT